MGGDPGHAVVTSQDDPRADSPSWHADEVSLFDGDGYDGFWEAETGHRARRDGSWPAGTKELSSRAPGTAPPPSDLEGSGRPRLQPEEAVARAHPEGASRRQHDGGWQHVGGGWQQTGARPAWAEGSEQDSWHEFSSQEAQRDGPWLMGGRARMANGAGVDGEAYRPRSFSEEVSVSSWLGVEGPRGGSRGCWSAGSRVALLPLWAV